VAARCKVLGRSAVSCAKKAEPIRWGARWHNLANMIELSMYSCQITLTTCCLKRPSVTHDVPHIRRHVDYHVYLAQ